MITYSINAEIVINSLGLKLILKCTWRLTLKNPQEEKYHALSMAAMPYINIDRVSTGILGYFTAVKCGRVSLSLHGRILLIIISMRILQLKLQEPR